MAASVSELDGLLSDIYDAVATARVFDDVELTVESIARITLLANKTNFGGLLWREKLGVMAVIGQCGTCEPRMHPVCLPPRSLPCSVCVSFVGVEGWGCLWGVGGRLCLCATRRVPPSLFWDSLPPRPSRVQCSHVHVGQPT